jgi:creatinine amidohydrolase
VNTALMKASPPAKVREMLEDGSFGGPWQLPDEVTQAIWDTGVAETREALESPWPTR